MDYSFVSQREEPSEDYPRGKTLSASVLSAVDVTTGMVTSCIVENKGSNEYSINELQRFILEVGRSSGVLQSDQEPAIKILCRDVGTKLSMTARLSPVGSKQSQGNVERWHRELHKAIRVFKEMIFENYKIKVGVGHPLLTWIVKHAAWIHNRYQLHTDGKTSYERRWGNN